MTIKILYIEDNFLNLRLMGKLLTAMNYTMLEAMDGATGLTLALHSLPHIIMTDVNLPDINGLELVGIIKQQPTLQGIPVIAVTCNAMAGDRENCLKAGCDGYLPKPITKIELKTLLERFINQRYASPSPAFSGIG